jgi:hypothetical protein
LTEGEGVYRYEKALVIEHVASKHWKEVDLSNTPVVGIFENYREILLVLSNTSLDYYITLDLKNARDLLNELPVSMSVTQWLTANGDGALQTVDGVPSINNVTVSYKDATRAGYKANLAFSHGDPFSEVYDNEKEDVLLTKPGVSYGDLHDHTLVTMNGLIHRTDHDHNGLYIKDGGNSFRTANMQHIGILNFKKLGKLKCITITPEMLYNPHRLGKLSEATYIELPESIGNRIVMLVIGGYLHMVESNYYCISDNVIKIDMANFPLLPRFYESKGLINLSQMTDVHESNQSNPDHVSVNDLFKDASISAYLTLSQSFVVLLETENFYVEKHKLGYLHLPGRYFACKKPTWPARTELGRLPEYVSIQEDDSWTLAIQDNFSTRYINETTGHLSDRSVASDAISANPVFYSKGHLLEIGSDKIVYTPKAYVAEVLP